MPREFLQLAHSYNPQTHKIGGYYVSEKLDGTRCIWIPFSRDIPTEDVPWANLINPKTGQKKTKIKPLSSGLWSRYGNPIMAPDWFLDQLPPFICDGELWAGRGNFQLCRSICGGDEPDSRFDQIHFAVFSSPPLEHLFKSGQIKNSHYHKTFNFDEIRAWIKTFSKGVPACPKGSTFDQELFAIRDQQYWNERIYLLRHTLLPKKEEEAREQLNHLLDVFIEQGGEGVIIRSPLNVWTPKRVHDVLKYKPWSDDEGIITGFTSGRKTDKGSKLLGMIGSLILDYKGKRLELSGLTHDERLFETSQMSAHAVQYPGVDMPTDFQGKVFKVGDTVTFKYRELSEDGIPKEARFFRKRGVE